MRVREHAQAAFAVLALVLLSAPAAAATEIALDVPATDPYDFASMQRGSKLFVNYCQGCHSLQYLRYTRLAEDLGLPSDIAQANLAFGEKLFRPMLTAISAEQAERWFNQAVPPDLSLTSRSRGEDWIYTFLRSFYRDPERPSGWNNLAFENTAMPHALQSLQGTAVLASDGSLAAAGGGRLNQVEYDLAVLDLVNFLAYAAEPVRNERVAIGYGVMIFILALLPVVYLMYREYWRAIK